MNCNKCFKSFFEPYLVYLWVMLSVLSGCDNESNGIIEKVYSGNNKYTIREKVLSVNMQHQISTFVTNNSGMGVIVDGEFLYFDDYAVRYRPIISDDGEYAWAQQMKGYGYDIIWQNHSVLHSDACLDFLTAGSTIAVCIESDLKENNITRFYLIDLTSGNSNCIASLNNEYIEDVCRFDTDMFGVITCYFDLNGIKFYNLYCVNGETADVNKIVENEEKLVTFPNQSTTDESLVVDYVQMSDNDRYLFNALTLLDWGAYNCDAFAFGNDFRGRMSWGESERLRGLCELYKKTNDQRIKAIVNDVVDGILNARNQFTGIVTDNWNPIFLWSSKCYTIDDSPASLLIDNSEILSSLLYACNEGIVNNKYVVATAEKAFDYYDQWYKDGHYYEPYGLPTSLDGIVVPWNYQNSFADVCLGLYLETGNQKYLNRCNELLSAFMREWKEESDRIYWHYWPKSYYNGWEDDGRSKNKPSSYPTTDFLFEDVSHAGMSIRLIGRYFENIPNGVISMSSLKKIESNMNYFCFKDGFAYTIGGDTSYNPKSWHYGVSPCFAYFHNEAFEKYIKQGYLKCFPLWNSMESIFANAKLYKLGQQDGVICIDRILYNFDGKKMNNHSFVFQNVFDYFYNLDH